MKAFQRGLLSSISGGLAGLEQKVQDDTAYARKMSLIDYQASKQLELAKLKEQWDVAAEKRANVQGAVERAEQHGYDVFKLGMEGENSKAVASIQASNKAPPASVSKGMGKSYLRQIDSSADTIRTNVLAQMEKAGIDDGSLLPPITDEYTLLEWLPAAAQKAERGGASDLAKRLRKMRSNIVAATDDITRMAEVERSVDDAAYMSVLQKYFGEFGDLFGGQDTTSQYLDTSNKASAPSRGGAMSPEATRRRAEELMNAYKTGG